MTLIAKSTAVTGPRGYAYVTLPKPVDFATNNVPLVYADNFFTRKVLIVNMKV